MRPPVWLADVDGIAHARALASSTRTVCGIKAVAERYAWPRKATCEVCRLATATKGAAPCHR